MNCRTIRISPPFYLCVASSLSSVGSDMNFDPPRTWWCGDPRAHARQLSNNNLQKAVDRLPHFGKFSLIPHENSVPEFSRLAVNFIDRLLKILLHIIHVNNTFVIVNDVLCFMSLKNLCVTYQCVPNLILELASPGLTPRECFCYRRMVLQILRGGCGNRLSQILLKNPKAQVKDPDVSVLFCSNIFSHTDIRSVELFRMINHTQKMIVGIRVV